MIELDFAGIYRVLCECRKLVGATRRLLGSAGVIIPHMGELERDLTDRAGEMKEFMRVMAEDGCRPLLGGDLARTEFPEEPEKSGDPRVGKSAKAANS